MGFALVWSALATGAGNVPTGINKVFSSPLRASDGSHGTGGSPVSCGSVIIQLLFIANGKSEDFRRAHS